MKKRFIIIILLILFYVIVVNFKEIIHLDNFNSSNQKNNDIVSLDSLTNLNDLINTTDGYFYFGRPDCIDCRYFQNLLEKFTQNKKNKIYYINTLYFRKTYTNFNDFLSEKKITTVPLLIHFKNGVEINKITAYQNEKKINIKEIINFFNSNN